jgi:hypothetical protein
MRRSVRPCSVESPSVASLQTGVSEKLGEKPSRPAVSVDTVNYKIRNEEDGYSQRPGREARRAFH